MEGRLLNDESGVLTTEQFWTENRNKKSFPKTAKIQLGPVATFESRFETTNHRDRIFSIPVTLRRFGICFLVKDSQLEQQHFQASSGLHGLLGHKIYVRGVCGVRVCDCHACDECVFVRVHW